MRAHKRVSLLLFLGTVRDITLAVARIYYMEPMTIGATSTALPCLANHEHSSSKYCGIVLFWFGSFFLFFLFLLSYIRLPFPAAVSSTRITFQLLWHWTPPVMSCPFSPVMCPRWTKQPNHTPFVSSPCPPLISFADWRRGAQLLKCNGPST